ncbi:NACHT domain-containing NTPase [Streptomyces sp. VRA16 Mangrove soil]|uniref:NACHT domain-containing protein n=1 Tax=Streptomyces sp. VRA16 Mangrove soil TaxID=2817434 RepID=UPI001A9D12AF|nr:NACHT domain-containing protein [Streptomyces sp. VRA16 Mangrove soil]MBO1333885.1 NACHT domain-containing protein [Streptomyces sp. VRA16 Mangrove soil]
MVDPGTVGVRVASSAVAPLIRKLFTQPGPGAALTDQPVRLSALVSFKGERRTLGPEQLRRLVRELVERAGRSLPESLVDEELEAVADALDMTLCSLGDLELDDVQAVDLGPEALALRLYEQAGGPRLTRFLSQEATALYGQLLDSACVNILHFFTQRSPFVARTLVEQSRRLRELIERTDLLIERLGSQPVGDADFEARYAAHLAKKHSSLTIYGIDLHETRQWPLDTAYLSLQATRGPEHSYADDLAALPTPSWAPALGRPVEQALSGHTRVLLRGTAGSGKTTLVQWLAVTTARQSRLTGDLAHLIGRVPFVLPLRTLTRKGAELPVPADFLRAIGSPLTGGQPGGWADRVLAAGRALLLVDGIDEVPEQERERARAWLTDLLSAYPDNLCLVTSRPSAVRQDWLGTEDFTELTLSPMSRENVAVFVGRWHEAAGAEPDLAAALLDAIRTKQDLGRLATNPLMCALICALHRERRGFLPRGRKALYDAALSMLLERRDRERDMPGAGLDLDAESQTELLQKLAYWLIRNGRSEMDRADALTQLERLLPAMPGVAEQGTADTVLRHLLVRSGVLREPAPGSVDFVHRTFQDHLGARAAVEERDFDLLLRHAHLDQWEDVLRMAVAHARPDERARLLRGLTARGDAEPEHRKRLHLLSMACLEHAAKLDPRVRTEVEERATALIPPRDFREARELADLGPIVLELLPGPDELTDPLCAQYVVQTAGLIGGDAALPCLIRYRGSDDAGVRFQLGQHWSRFDTDEYADRIVDGLRGDFGIPLTVQSTAELAALRRLGGHSNLDCVGDFTGGQLLEHLATFSVRRLRLGENAVLDGLDFVRRLPDLRELSLYRCPSVPSLAPLGGLPLENLFVAQLPLVDDPAPLRTLTALKVVNLRTLRAAADLADLSRDAPLECVFPPVNVRGLAALLDFPHLEQVGLNLDTPLGTEDRDVLARMRKLTCLTLSGDELAALAALDGTVLDTVTDVFVHGSGARPVGTAQVPALFPALRTLTVLTTADIDLAPLADCPELHTLYVTDAASVRHADTLPGRVRLTLSPRPVPPPPPTSQ